MTPSRSKLAPHRRAVENALTAGTPRAAIARRFDVSRDGFHDFIARNLPQHATPAEAAKLVASRERTRSRSRSRNAEFRQWRAQETNTAAVL